MRFPLPDATGPRPGGPTGSASTRRVVARADNRRRSPQGPSRRRARTRASLWRLACWCSIDGGSRCVLEANDVGLFRAMEADRKDSLLGRQPPGTNAASNVAPATQRVMNITPELAAERLVPFPGLCRDDRRQRCSPEGTRTVVCGAARDLAQHVELDQTVTPDWRQACAPDRAALRQAHRVVGRGTRGGRSHTGKQQFLALP